MGRIKQKLRLVEWTELLIPICSGIFGGILGLALYRLLF